MDSARQDGSVEHAESEVARLEAQLTTAKAKLLQAKKSTELTHRGPHSSSPSTAPPEKPLITSANHFLLLLSDSALPLGSFAFSSGLESYLAHTPRRTSSFSVFLPESVSSYASTTLPFVLAAWRDPSSLEALDDELDAAIICSVGRRASMAQGRALVSIWERSFAGSAASEASEVIRPYADLLRSTSWAASSSSTACSGSENGTGAGSGGEELPPPVHAHLGPLFGAVCKVVGLTLQQTAYVFMLSHVKALVSAAVRASMFGPYQAQKVLGSPGVQVMITKAIDREWDTPVQEAGQTMPVMDLWIGRHEVLYSRIFNS